jgi:hypothetical protein
MVLFIFEGKGFVILYCEVGGTGFKVSEVRQSNHSSGQALRVPGG